MLNHMIILEHFGILLFEMFLFVYIRSWSRSRGNILHQIDDCFIHIKHQFCRQTSRDLGVNELLYPDFRWQNRFWGFWDAQGKLSKWFEAWNLLSIYSLFSLRFKTFKHSISLTKTLTNFQKLQIRSQKCILASPHSTLSNCSSSKYDLEPFEHYIIYFLEDCF